MGITWGDMKKLLQAVDPSLIGGTIDVEDELPQMAYLANMRIVNDEHKFRCMIREATLSLTGAGEYDLTTLIPGFQQAFQILDGDREVGFRGLDEYLVTTGGRVFAFRGKTLLVRDDPGSGSLKMPYFSTYAVLDKDGTTFKLQFEDDLDTTAFYDEQANLVFEGILELCMRRGKEKYVRRVQLPNGMVVDMSPFEHERQKNILSDNPVNRSFWNYLYLPS